MKPEDRNDGGALGGRTASRHHVEPILDKTPGVSSEPLSDTYPEKCATIEIDRAINGLDFLVERGELSDSTAAASLEMLNSEKQKRHEPVTPENAGHRADEIRKRLARIRKRYKK